MYYDEEENCNYLTWHDLPFYRRQRAPFEGHYANKNEAKTLRRIMSQTGLTEKEVRDIKKYRIELSQAQKECGSKNGLKRLARKFLKSLTRELKLPLMHPKVREAYSKKLNEASKWSSFGRLKTYGIDYSHALELIGKWQKQ